MATTTEATILSIAAAAAGVCTRAELLAAGVPGRTISARVSSGSLVRIGHGLYEVPTLVTDETPIYRAARAHPDGAISHGTAARLWGFPLPPLESGAPVELTVPRPASTRIRVVGVRVHGTRRWAAADLAAAAPGLTATSPARTIVDLTGTTIGDRRLRHVVQTELARGQLTLNDVAEN